MKLSIVIPIFNEEEIIPLLKQRLSKALDSLNCDKEIIIIDDGSQDTTVEKVKEWVLEDPNVTLIELSRNFGHQAAISAGLSEGTGDCLVILDADLQDPPEVISQMLEKWKEGFKIVIAERISRKEGFIRGLGFRFFYKIFA